MVLVGELLWSVSFFGRLTHLPQVTGIADYMFDKQSPLWLRAVSLFHLPLLAVVVWSPWRLGYDPGVYPWAVLIAWLVLMTAVPLLLQLPGHLLLWVMFGN